ncbi:DUF2303 family protein [Nonomuraea sp. NPDC049709]|uniref:DUF2303 family protein n=1 Tax=Nonomuraea sp. NPDC049709 TaxID=3154736 RepID=UPI0034166D67
MPANDTTRTENDAVIQIAQEAARAQAAPVAVQPGSMYAFPTADGYKLLDLDNDGYTDRLPAPQRKRGITTVEDIDSFLTYYAKHADANTETYVDVDSRRITAVLNAHSPDGPRWGDHRLVLELKCTRAWLEWTRFDRKPLTQQEFAEHIENHLDDIIEPQPAQMLEIATTFQAKQKVSFSSATRLSSGDVNIAWEETTDATAGSKGQLKVPTEFKIAVVVLELPVPEGEDPTVHGLQARFRYRIDRGNLQVSYLLAKPEAVLRDAVLAVVGQVEKALETQVLRGTPASA